MTTQPLSDDRLRTAVPHMTGSVRLAGLEAPVEIYRDPEGIPHVRARSTGDAFFGQGFAHAQDRLWQMEYDRRRAHGRWAELVGPAGVEQDRLMRRFRLGATARSDFEGLLPETRAMLEAYAAGVNAFIEQAGELPVEFGLLGVRPEPWLPWDGLAVYKVRHIGMGVWESKLWRARLLNQVGLERLQALYPGAQPGEALILPPGAVYDGPVGVAIEELSKQLGSLDWVKEEGGGSNNWVVDGGRTASGKPLLAGDPHRAVDVPNVYYQNHLACDRFDVIGLSFPGLPAFPHFGHNERVAWCITHTAADTQDLFVERFDLTDPTRYLFQGEWRTAKVHRESILVRGAEPVDLEIVETHHGAVIAGDPASGYGLTMRYTATLGENAGWNALLPMLLSRSCEELDASVRDWVDPVNNLLYADIDGNIGYRMRGLLPIRPPVNGWIPVPGWTGEHEWQGMLPYDEMPVMVNPPDGWLATANNRVTGPEYPHYISLFFAADNRARRIQDRLAKAGPLTPEEMASIHADLLSLPALQYKELLDRVRPRTEAGARAKGLLAAWDGQVKGDQAAPAIYNVAREELVTALLKPLLGPLAPDAFAYAARGGAALVQTTRQRIFGWVATDDRTLLPEGVTWSAMLTDALELAVTKLSEQFGPDMAQWRWERLHQLRPVHPLAAVFQEAAGRLAPAPSPMDGDHDTVQAATYIPVTGFAVTATSVARYLFDLSDWEQSGWVVPHGASGHQGSPHFADQNEAWLAHRLHPMRYGWNLISAEAKSVQRLEPAK